MSGLGNIAVRVVSAGMSGGASGIPWAIASEVHDLVQALAASGREGCIDLRALPMAPGDYERLKEILGQGEVSATVQALGPTRVYETAFPGVWWVSHYSADEQMVADRIEVCLVPEILRSHPDDVGQGLERLKRRLEDNRELAGAAAEAPLGGSAPT